jgi:hypothetical protein
MAYLLIHDVRNLKSPSRPDVNKDMVSNLTEVIQYLCFTLRLEPSNVVSSAAGLPLTKLCCSHTLSRFMICIQFESKHHL